MFPKIKFVIKEYSPEIMVILFSWIVLVSMFDHYLTIKLQDVIIHTEQNPIGRLLIKIDGGSVALFMTLKMFFLWIIFISIFYLYKWKKHYALITLKTLALLQTILVWYLLM